MAKAELSLIDLADPDAVVEAAIDVYGSDATTAAAWSALSARDDGRDRDFRFWFAVFMKLKDGHGGWSALQ